jgi:uncharacterized protein involved in exopolysaccharide biosynthesis
MVTYKNTLCSEVVIEDALAKLPNEYRAWLADVPRDRWAEALQANLNVTIVRNSTILKIAYQSERPYEAEAVVQSIIQAYLDFMNKLHQNAAGEVYDIFHREKVALEKQIQTKQCELVAARKNAEELEIRDGEKGTSVVIKSAITRNEAWNEAHKERLDAQARLVAIEAAVRNGEDLVEFALTAADKMGGEWFLQRLGLNLPDPNAASHIRRQLTEDQAKLQSVLQVYGNAHHKVREIQERIQASGYLLQNQHRMNRAQLHQISNDELAGLLLETARQQFKQAAARENLALSSYEEAKHAAVALDGARAQLDMLKLDWNHLQRTYEIVLERLKDINLDQKNGTLRIKVLSKPKVPAAPVWPRITVVAFLSIIAGLGGGVAVVYLQDILDDRFRSPEEMQTQLGLPVLAMIGKLEPLPDHGTDAIHVHVRDLAHRAGPDRERYATAGRLQQRAGRRQDHGRRKPCHSLCTIGETHTADRRRHAAPGPDASAGVEGTAGAFDRTSSGGSNRKSRRGEHLPGNSREPGRNPLRTAPGQSDRTARRRPILRASILGRNTLRPDTDRQSSGTGQRYGHYRPARRRRVAYRAAGEKSAAGGYPIGRELPGAWDQGARDRC